MIKSRFSRMQRKSESPTLLAKPLRRRHVISAAVVIAICGVAQACNIPVFRYALERWKSDAYEVLVFHNEAFDPAASEQVSKLQKQADQLGNISVELVPLSAMTAEQTTTWKQFGPDTGPASTNKESASDTAQAYVLLQAQLKRKKLNIWQGNLSEFDSASLLRSPARKKVASRLLAGDSVVWLVLLGEEPQANDQLRSTLTAAFDKLES
ncbi:MAG: hypothetical protein AAGG44_07095, partial [Planctomycetota bacterium]